MILTPDQEQTFHRILSLIDFGDNITINVVDKPTGDYYIFQIRYDGCYESPRFVSIAKKVSTKTCQKPIEDDGQLQLAFT